MHDGGEVILKYHHLNQMFYVLSKTISIPSTFLVWLNKPGVSRIVISRTPIFHFSRPLSILHAAIKQKSSNHTESPLPFTPTPQPPSPKKEANSLSNCPTRTTFFFTLHGDSHHQGTQMAEMWHGPSTAARQRPLQHLAARARRQLLAVEATTWGQKLCQVGSRLFFFRWNNCEKINSKYSVCCVFVVCWVRMYCTQMDYEECEPTWRLNAPKSWWVWTKVGT